MINIEDFFNEDKNISIDEKVLKGNSNDFNIINIEKKLLSDYLNKSGLNCCDSYICLNNYSNSNPYFNELLHYDISLFNYS